MAETSSLHKPLLRSGHDALEAKPGPTETTGAMIKTLRTYMGAEITLAWPSAALMPGACKPSYEKWEAYTDMGDRFASDSLAKLKTAIRMYVAVPTL